VSHWTRRYPELVARGERVRGAKLDAMAVREIRELAGKTSARELADYYEITRQQVNRIIAGTSWAHIR
jgi:hypothetical protein